MPDLSIVIPTRQEADALAALFPQLQAILASLGVEYEIWVVDRHGDEATRQAVAQFRGNLISLSAEGYGAALIAGFAHARGEYILTMDADLSHPPAFLANLWAARQRADIVIASRYTHGGQARLPIGRKVFSRVLNLVFSRGLDLNVRDLSSGFRLYRADVLRQLKAENTKLAVLQEILVKALMEGYRIAEIPFHYAPRHPSATARRVLHFGWDYLKTFTRLWKLRNSIASADYDARAYHALMPPQRYWQRQRYRHITAMVRGGGPCLDVGCGSSRILAALPPGSIALDILMRKLRYSRCYALPLVQGSALDLPVKTAAFPCVICSQVIEHIPRARVLSELDRALQAGGLLVVGTPDYGRWQWRVIERLYKLILPQAYADEHITHYTRADLLEEYVHQRGYQLETEHYILGGELILALRKPENRPEAYSG